MHSPVSTPSAARQRRRPSSSSRPSSSREGTARCRRRACDRAWACLPRAWAGHRSSSRATGRCRRSREAMGRCRLSRACDRAWVCRRRAWACSRATGRCRRRAWAAHGPSEAAWACFRRCGREERRAARTATALRRIGRAGSLRFECRFGPTASSRACAARATMRSWRGVCAVEGLGPRALMRHERERDPVHGIGYGTGRTRGSILS